MSGRSFWTAVAAVALLGILLRLAVGWELRGIPLVAHPPSGTDMRRYVDIAAAMVDGRVPKQFYYQPFYSAVFLPLVFALVGRSPMALIAVQAIVIGGATILLTGWIGASLFGRAAGVIAAACLALAQYHIFVGEFALSDGLGALGMTASIAMLLQSIRRPAWWRWALVGVLIGVTTDTRGNGLILVPAALALLAWRLREDRWRVIRDAVLMLVFVVACQLPFVIRNWQGTGRWTGPATSSEITLALGNTPESPPGVFIYSPTFRAWRAAAEARGAAHVPVVQSLFAWIRREPLAWLELKLRASLLFWNAIDIPNNVDLGGDGLSYSRVLRLPVLVTQGCVLSLGLAGLMLALWRRDAWRDVRVLVVCYCVAALFVSTALLFIVSRFRVAAVPLLCVLSGYALVETGTRLGASVRRGAAAREQRRVIFAGLAIGAAALFVYQGFDVYHDHLEREIIRRVRPHGVLGVAGDERLVYDHGPQWFGGWKRVALPADMATRFEKRFSLPPEIAGLTPARIRLPIVVPAPARVHVDVSTRGRLVGTFDGSVIPSDQWLEIPLAMDDVRASPGDELPLDIAIAPQGTYAQTVVDTARAYDRTRLDVLGDPRVVWPAQMESCAELVLAPRASRASRAP